MKHLLERQEKICIDNLKCKYYKIHLCSKFSFKKTIQLGGNIIMMNMKLEKKLGKKLFAGLINPIKYK